MCAQKRAKYVLATPKPDVKDMYVKEIQSQLLADAEARSQLSDSLPKMHLMPKTNFLVQPCVEYQLKRSSTKPYKYVGSMLALCF